MITLSKVSKSFGSRILFDDVTITFNAGNRYGLTAQMAPANQPS